MNLEISDSIWSMIVRNARKAKEMQTHWQSPMELKPYKIGNVEDDKISIVRLAGGNSSVFGKDHFFQLLRKINDFNGTIPRNEFGAGVANMSAMVFLHPGLTWSTDFNSIVTNQFDIGVFFVRTCRVFIGRLISAGRWLFAFR